MKTVKNLFNACQSSVCKLDKSDIRCKQDLPLKLSKALGENFVVIHSYCGYIGITPQVLELNSNDPLLIVKTTFTKQHGLKHCIIKLNPRLSELGLRFDTTLNDAYNLARCLKQLDNRHYLLDKLGDESTHYDFLKEITDIEHYINEKLPKITDANIKANLEWRFNKKCR